jgi:ABC-2 type transport system permease protein
MRTVQLGRAPPGQWIKNALISAFLCVLMFGLFESTRSSLDQLEMAGEWLASGANESRTLVIELLFSLLMVLTFLSSIVGALSLLYFSEDRELVAASACSAPRAHWGRVVELAWVGGWFPLMLTLPVALAVLTHYAAPWPIFLLVLSALIWLVLLASSFSLGVMQVLGLLLSAHTVRRLLLVSALVIFIGIAATTPAREAVNFLKQDLTDILLSAVDQRRSAPQGEGESVWFPPSVAARFISSFWHLAPTPEAPVPRRVTDAAQTSSFAWLILLWTIVTYHASRRVNERWLRAAELQQVAACGHWRINSRLAQRIARGTLIGVLPPYRALITKEIKLFSRDLIQAIQLMVLLGLCVLYLYNFQSLRQAGEFAGLEPVVQAWWSALLVLLNVAVGALVAATIGMRFVFPSVSMEGKGLWILQAAPISIPQVLRAKFWCWFVPLGGMMSVIMVSGGMAVDAEPRIIAVSGLSSWVMCYGVLGLAVGMGAAFSNFSWDHPAQITAGMGAVLYFLACVLLIAVSMLPIGGLLAARTLREQGMHFSSLQWAALVLLLSASLVYLHVLVHRWAMHVGHTALIRQ